MERNLFRRVEVAFPDPRPRAACADARGSGAVPRRTPPIPGCCSPMAPTCAPRDGATNAVSAQTSLLQRYSGNSTAWQDSHPPPWRLIQDVNTRSRRPCARSHSISSLRSAAVSGCSRKERMRSRSSSVRGLPVSTQSGNRRFAAVPVQQHRQAQDQDQVDAALVPGR